MVTQPRVGTFRMRPAKELLKYAHNPRLHSGDQIDQLRRSIREFGFTNPLLVTPAGMIIAGHGRLEAAVAEGMVDVPCIELAGLSEAQVRALVMADNQLALNASWDAQLLALELGLLQGAGFDLDVLGFSQAELDELLAPALAEGLTDPDDAPPLPDEARTKPGQVWICGPHRVFCGDAANNSAVHGFMCASRADVIWTDPPYNVAYEGKAGTLAGDDQSPEEFQAMLRGAFAVAFLALKAGGAIYVSHADTEGWAFRDAFKAAGFKLAGVLVWRKNSLVLGRSDYQWIHEPILYGWKPGARHRWFGGRKQTTVADVGEPFSQQADGTWSVLVDGRLFVVSDPGAKVQELAPSVLDVPKPKRNAEHPTMKPVALIAQQLANSARPGDLVLDLFGGSGSTMIAAEQLGMSARLVELDPRFVDVTVDRWQAYTGRTAVLEGASQ